MRYYQDFMSVERSGNHRGGNMPGLCSFITKYPAQNECFGIYGIFEGKEQSDDISKIWEHEICISKPGILV